jgi:segregation and condensation protein B
MSDHSLTKDQEDGGSKPRRKAGARRSKTSKEVETPSVDESVTLGDLVAALAGEAGVEGDPAGEQMLDQEDDDLGSLDMADELPVDPDDDLTSVEGEASARLVSIVESLLFASTKPMTVKQLRRILKEPTVHQLQLAVKQVMKDTAERGVVLGQVAGGFRFRTHPANAQYVQKLIAGRPVRLSRSQLETLAVVAYRQPITKVEVDHVRGVDCSAVLKLLLDRDLVKIVGRKEEPGRPHLYGTTVRFLEFFNLRSLRDMPDLHEFRELTEEDRATLRAKLGEAPEDEREAMGQRRLDLESSDDDLAADGAQRGGIEGDEVEDALGGDDLRHGGSDDEPGGDDEPPQDGDRE